MLMTKKTKNNIKKVLILILAFLLEGILAFLLISGISDKVISDELIAFGEIGLSGEVRAVSHIEYRVKEAVRLGFTKIVLPKKNVSQRLKVPSGVELLGVSNIYEALLHMAPKN